MDEKLGLENEYGTLNNENIGEGGLVTIGFRTKDDEYKYYVYNFREKVMEMNCLFREQE